MEVLQYRDTGELSDVTVKVTEKEFKLHKFPLYIKSEFFKENVQAAEEIDLENFPGGAAIFTLVADFCYGKPIDFTLGNIAGLRNAAEYLQMKGQGNLVAVTEKYIEDILSSAKLSRSVAPIMEILVQCGEIGKEFDTAKVGQKCFNAISEIWMRPSSRFSPRGGSSRGGSDHYEDSMISDRLVQMPLDWFLELIKTCVDQESKLKALADLVYKYLAKVFVQADKLDKGKSKKKPAKKADDEGGEEEDDKKDDGAASDAEADDKKDKKADGCEGTGNPGETLDAVIMAVPENTPLADLITIDWIRRALEISEDYGCECRDRLLQLAGNVLHRFNSDELKQIPSETLCEVIDNTVKNEKVMPEVLTCVLDTYLHDLAKKRNLSVDDFVKLVKSVPDSYRINHDTLFDVLEQLLSSGEDIPDEKKKTLLDAVDLSRCHEKTLQRALEKNLVPARDLCQAAIDLAGRLRSEKDESTVRPPKYVTEDSDRIRGTRASYLSSTPRAGGAYGGGGYGGGSYGAGGLSNYDYDQPPYSSSPYSSRSRATPAYEKRRMDSDRRY